MRRQVRWSLSTTSFAAMTLVWGWIAWSYAGGTDRAVLVTEVAATAVLGITALLAPTARARWTIGTIAGWTGLTALADSYWLLTAGSPSVSYAQGSYEPTPSVVLFLLRYALGAAALALSLPQHGRRRTRRAAVGDALGAVQVVAGAGALVTLSPWVDALLGDRGPSSTFLAADVLLGAAAIGTAARALLSGDGFPRQSRVLVVATSTTVLALAAADAAMVVSLLHGSTASGIASYSLSISGCVLCVVVHLRERGESATTACLPPVPGTHDGSRLAIRVLTRLVVPASVLVLATNRLSTGEVPPPHQLGLVALSSTLALVVAVRHLARAERDERSAADVVRDHLTGAWSRGGLVEQLSLRRAGGRRDGFRTWTVVALDLDGFKAVNDTHGHGAGDEVLRATVSRIATVVGDRGLLARLGGDEFVVVLPALERRTDDAADLVERLLAAVSLPHGLPGGTVVRVGTSVGVADVRADTWDGEAHSLLAEADGRMYQDKRARRRASAPASPTAPRAAVPN